MRTRSAPPSEHRRTTPSPRLDHRWDQSSRLTPLSTQVFHISFIEDRTGEGFDVSADVAFRVEDAERLVNRNNRKRFSDTSYVGCNCRKTSQLMTNRDYPLFVPPAPLAEHKPREWSREEAKKYLQWIIQISDERTDQLLRYFDENPNTFADDPQGLLTRMGERVAEELRSAGFSELRGESRKLNNRGHAVAADMGLLVARLLLAQSESTIRWSIRDRPKRDAFYNHPVLSGFGDLTLEPVGGSIADAHSILRGERGPDSWERAFTHWAARAQEARRQGRQA